MPELESRVYQRAGGKGVQGASEILESAEVLIKPPGRHFNPGDSQVEIANIQGVQGASDILE